MTAIQPERRIGFLLLVIGVVAFGVFTYLSSEARHRVRGVPMRDSHSGIGGISFSFPVYRPSPYVPKLIPVPGLAIDQFVVSRALYESLPVFWPAPQSLLIHEARLFGNDTNFNSIIELDVPMRHSHSSEMVEWLLNGVENKKNILGKGDAPYLDLSNFGVHVSLYGPDAGNDDRGEAHFGQVAAVMGLVGVAPERVIITDSGVEKCFCDLLNDLVSNYSDDHELEFFALAMVLYLDAPYEWVDRYGNRCSIDTLTRRLVSQTGTSCYGTHVPFAIALALQRDRDKGNVLSKNTRDLAVYYMQKLSRDLDLRHPNDDDWGDLSNGESGAKQFPQKFDKQRNERLTILGHHLEWIAIADPAYRPSTEIINEAVRSLSDIIVNFPPMEARTYKSQLPMSHAARALVSLSGKPLGFHVSKIQGR